MEYIPLGGRSFPTFFSLIARYPLASGFDGRYLDIEGGHERDFKAFQSPIILVIDQKMGLIKGTRRRECREEQVDIKIKSGY